MTSKALTIEERAERVQKVANDLNHEINGLVQAGGVVQVDVQQHTIQGHGGKPVTLIKVHVDTLQRIGDSVQPEPDIPPADGN